MQRIDDAEHFLLSRPKDVYGQQVDTLFNTKLLQIPVKINQVVSAHLQIRDYGKLRDMMVAVEDLQLVQDLVRFEEQNLCLPSRHEDASAHKKLGNGFVASEDLNAKFRAYPDIYSGKFLSRMCQRIEDDIEIMIEQVKKCSAMRRTRPSTTGVILLGG